MDPRILNFRQKKQKGNYIRLIIINLLKNSDGQQPKEKQDRIRARLVRSYPARGQWSDIFEALEENTTFSHKQKPETFPAKKMSKELFSRKNVMPGGNLA